LRRGLSGAPQLLTKGLDKLLRRRYRLGMNEKLKGLEDVLANMAHDLRTPLAVVHTTTTMLLNPKYKFTEDQVREQHLRIQRNVEVMDRLITQLSELARRADGQETSDPQPTRVDGA
jgi:signal transduction histidine kinase